MNGTWIARAVCMGSMGIAGCGWINTRSDFERDPFVMSHLTHEKRDQMFANSDSDVTIDGEERPVRSASRKPPTSEPTEIEGRLSFQKGKAPGWYLRPLAAGSVGDGLRLLPDPRLSIAHEGDRVRLRGRNVDDGSSTAYQITSLAFLDD